MTELLSAREAESRTLEALARVAGPLTQESFRGQAGSRADWYRGQYQGRAVRVGLGDYEGVFDGIYFCSAVADLPIQISMYGRSGRAVRPGDFTTGDVRFDSQFSVTCSPEEVVRAALGDSPRQWLLDAFAGSHPNMNTEDGFVHVRVQLSAGGSGKTTRAMPADEIALWIGRMRDLEECLRDAFERVRSGIAATQGDAAARAWLDGHAGALASAQASRKSLRILLYAAIALIVGVPLLLAVVLLLWLLWV